MLEGVAENLELDDRLTLIFFGSVLASCFVSFMLRRFYLWAVHRGMRGSAPEPFEEAANPLCEAAPDPAPRLESRTDRLNQPLKVSHDAARWYARAKNSRYFAARIYALAGYARAARAGGRASGARRSQGARLRPA